VTFIQVTILVLASSVAVPIDGLKDSEKLQSASEPKRHEKRNVDCSNGHGIHIYCPPDYEAPLEPSPVLVQQPVGELTYKILLILNIFISKLKPVVILINLIP